MIIKTERLILEPLGYKHLDDFNVYATDKEAIKYMLFFPTDDREDSKEYLTRSEEQWNSDKQDVWELAVLLDGKNIGYVGIYDEDGKAELGWLFSKDYQGKGYAYESACAAVEYAKKLGYTEFVAHCDSANAPSYGLMEKLGMKRISEKFGRKNKLSNPDRTEYTYYMGGV